MSKEMLQRAEIALGNDIDWRRLCAERGKEATKRLALAFQQSLDHGKTPPSLDALLKEVIYQADLLGEAETAVAAQRRHLEDVKRRLAA